MSAGGENKLAQNDIDKIKKEIESKLREYGSVDLIVRLILKEMRARISVDIMSSWGERPMVAYLAGLFLSNNNLEAGKPNSDQIQELEELLIDYFDRFNLQIEHWKTSNIRPYDHIKFAFQLQKTSNDVDPGSYPGQTNEYYRQVFVQLDQYFSSRHGFTVEQALHFTTLIFNKITDEISNTCANVTNLRDIFVIDPDDFCNKQNIQDKNAFKKCLNTFSCSFGDQLQEFTDPLSDNIVNFKPIIKLNEHAFFVLKHELDRSLVKMLEFLLEEEKQKTPSVWNKFCDLRSKYVESSAYRILSKMFPNQIFRNAHFLYKNREYETDLLIIHDNKILVIESRSGSFPASAMRGSIRSLKKRMNALVQKPMLQATNVRDYIMSQSKAVLWADKPKTKALIEIESAQNYKFLVISVTLVHLGGLAANLRNIDAFQFFESGEYPWLVYLYDLDIVVDMLETPSRFIDYVEKRIHAHQENIFEAESELIFLGYYQKKGNFIPQKIDGKRVTKMVLTTDWMDDLERCYLQ